jgi:hypothetical protein
MDMFDIMISMVNNLLYVIIITLIYGIKMTWKLPNILTVVSYKMADFTVYDSIVWRILGRRSLVSSWWMLRHRGFITLVGRLCADVFFLAHPVG